LLLLPPRLAAHFGLRVLIDVTATEKEIEDGAALIAKLLRLSIVGRQHRTKAKGKRGCGKRKPTNPSGPVNLSCHRAVPHLPGILHRQLLSVHTTNII
jgi:hypothetical protein